MKRGSGDHEDEGLRKKQKVAVAPEFGTPPEQLAVSGSEYNDLTSLQDKAQFSVCYAESQLSKSKMEKKKLLAKYRSDVSSLFLLPPVPNSSLWNSGPK